jgi:copper chaperone NosL
MKRAAPVILLLFTLLACNVEPEPLHYGTDACHTCKMTLMDKKFGAELVTQKGKVYKFDDINCMLSFYNSSDIDPQEFKYRLVVDFSQPEKLIEANNAFYLKSPEILTPMASQVAAFETKDSMETLKKKWNGIYLVWGELVTQFKK